MGEHPGPWERTAAKLAHVHPDLVPHDDVAALLFDWDGTLVDSQPANFAAMAAVLRGEGVHLPQDWFDARTGLSSAEMIRAYVAQTGHELSRPVEALVADRDEIFLGQARHVRPHGVVRSVVDAHHGVVPMAIASGGARRIIGTTLRHQPFADAFDAIVTRDDVGRGKPAPDIFLAAADALGVAPEKCLVYEDSDEGIASAAAAGIRCIDVRPYR